VCVDEVTNSPSNLCLPRQCLLAPQKVDADEGCLLILECHRMNEGRPLACAWR
jgi:hypothetical protein